MLPAPSKQAHDHLCICCCWGVQDDWDIGEEGVAGVQQDLREQPEVQEKLQRRIKSVNVKVGGWA